MAKRKVFYSFHYKNDVTRVQQVRNMGALEGNKPVTANKWEEIKNDGEAAIKRWIGNNLENKSCLVVLVGEKTASRKWVKYEIEQAWNSGMAVMGIYIHNLKCPMNGCSAKGANPFDDFEVGGKRFSSIVKCYNPAKDAYNDISENIEDWIEEAIEIRADYKS